MTGPANNPRVDLTWVDKSLKEVRFDIQRATDNTFTTGLVTFTVPANTQTYTDTTVTANSGYSYRVVAIGDIVGDTLLYPGSVGFPTMSADSVSSAVSVLVGADPGTPTAPTNLVATLQTGPRVSLTWRDNATNETGFAVERCTGVGCTNIARIAAPGPRNNTGNVTYVDTTITAGIDNSYYSYRVKALNSAGLSDNTNVVSVTVPAIPPAPTGFTVAVRINYPGTGTLVVWSQNANGERQDQLADRIGPYQGDSLIDFEGAQRTLRFEVRTADAWQIEILPLSAARHAAVPGVIEGSGDDAVVFEGAFLPDLLTVDASGATGEFSVWAYSHLHEQVINSNAPYTGTISIPRDTLALGIKAEGPWRIEVTTR